MQAPTEEGEVLGEFYTTRYVSAAAEFHGGATARTQRTPRGCLACPGRGTARIATGKHKRAQACWAGGRANDSHEGLQRGDRRGPGVQM